MDKSYKSVILPNDLHAVVKVMAAQKQMTIIALVRHLVEKEQAVRTTCVLNESK